MHGPLSPLQPLSLKIASVLVSRLCPQHTVLNSSLRHVLPCFTSVPVAFVFRACASCLGLATSRAVSAGCLYDNGVAGRLLWCVVMFYTSFDAFLLFILSTYPVSSFAHDSRRSPFFPYARPLPYYSTPYDTSFTFI